ncbi:MULTISPECIES: flagellar hook-length control protein FliK [unclassified Burkholderia]|uniref:flagellar hook-length control protein FliK n=1 Tax=unclassified Burkholderia TaxID=2613784 RepID=UPI000F57C33D|nr:MULTISPECIES: flagellar hook-length control protein FliK [unclassified Burkholderia]RQR45009.1 flagellar hook-length control protein FliK [Burkholderia sp. Bp9131]RQR76997.1 flagellar hook-length control protein FliK [Burkholderia sp. Bp9015]RQR85769.1 flagellar hook-length control protein FliK [Burkholderia sp. Bp9011]RQR95498.1 flagellar hook-length control protein FliK [Burkholderia sp. Bp9010]RQS79962.1 flagellar hook-length control protein FliK [Burkholderia sp. Bp8977]
MTESVSVPRSRSHSRSDRSSARSRPRSVAAAADTAAKATARSGNAGGDAPRDEHTLDLFGDPVREPAARAPAVSRDDAVADAEPMAAVVDGEDVARQATLDGFATPGAAADAVDPAPDVATTTEPASTRGNGDAVGADVVPAPAADTTKPGGARLSDGGGARAAGEPATGGGQMKAGSVSEAGGAAGTSADRSTANADAVGGAVDAAIADRLVKAGGEAEGAAVPVTHDDAARAPGETTKGRRASSGGKRRATAGTREAAAPAVRSVPGAAAVGAGAEVPPAQHTPPSAEPQATAETQASAEPQATAEPAGPVAAAIAASTLDAARAAAAPASPVVQPVASAASFVTKPSADRAQPAASSGPAFDPDTHLRPLSDRLATLQADTAGMKQAADREMRRVNRLLLALAIVVFAGLTALVLQTRQIAHLKQELDARQQRIDRLAADLSTQQATLMTLAEHHEAMLSQVDRLQRNANREAAAAKRVRRTH